MKVIKSAIHIQLTQEEKDKISEAREIISHLYDMMYDYEQEYAVSNAGEEYSMSQVCEASNLMGMLITSDKLLLENK